MKIYIYYNITEKPWGGGNSFLKAFRNYIHRSRKDVEIVTSINDDYDVFFMNGGHKDQGVYIDLKEVGKIARPSLIKRFLGKKRPEIIYRLDGARFRYSKTRSEMDDLQFKALSLADHAIFQSEECLDSFKEVGYSGKNYSIILNGVDQTIFNTHGKTRWDRGTTVKILSTGWSSNIHKGFEVISLFSEIEGVESYFVGNWCKEVDVRKVKVIPPVKQEELSLYYKDSDLFLHAAEDDPCPNVVLEALCSGLPIIYHNSGGTKELAANYGVPLPEIISKESLTATIKKIKTDYGLYVDRIENDMKRFSIDTVAEQYLAVFEKVLRSEG